MKIQNSNFYIFMVDNYPNNVPTYMHDICILYMHMYTVVSLTYSIWVSYGEQLYNHYIYTLYTQDLIMKILTLPSH